MSRVYEVTFNLNGGEQRKVEVRAGTRRVVEQSAYRRLGEEDKLRARRPGAVKFVGQS